MLKCTFENGNTTSLRHVVADVLVLRSDQILLVKRAGKLLETGKWALVGGFIEWDETIEAGARREVLEETGYTVSDLTLLRIKDSPGRPREDRQNISFAFFARRVKSYKGPTMSPRNNAGSLSPLCRRERKLRSTT